MDEQDNEPMLPTTIGDAGGPNCVLDRTVINEETLGNMTDMALSIFASACGKNRGAFVSDPPDGNTYSWYVNRQEKIITSSVGKYESVSARFCFLLFLLCCLCCCYCQLTLGEILSFPPFPRSLYH